MNNSTHFTLPNFPHAYLAIEGWCVAFGFTAVIIIFGNSVTIAALLYMKFPRKVHRWFLINLSAADLLVGTLALPMYVYLIYPSNFKRALRVFSFGYQAVDVFTGLASVFTLTTISLEHLYAIYMPLQHRATRKSNYLVLIGISWCLAALISGMFVLSYVGGLIPTHVFVYPMTIFSCSSLAIICFVYAAVWIKIKCWINKGSRLLGPAQERNLSIALAIVTFVFVFTWCPFHIMNIIANFKPSLLTNLSYDVIYFTKLLHYSNSCINPIIYSLKLPEFRSAVKQLFTRQTVYTIQVKETRV